MSNPHVSGKNYIQQPQRERLKIACDFLSMLMMNTAIARTFSQTKNNLFYPTSYNAAGDKSQHIVAIIERLNVKILSS